MCGEKKKKYGREIDRQKKHVRGGWQRSARLLLFVLAFLMAAVLPLGGNVSAAEDAPAKAAAAEETTAKAAAEEQTTETEVTAPEAPVLKSITRSGTTMTVKWGKVANCSGYLLQYSTNRFFVGSGKIKIGKAGAKSKQIKKVTKGLVYYVRIRAYRTYQGKTLKSAWTVSENSKKSRTAKREIMRSKLGFKVELRSAAKQVVPGYDSLQGACYGKGYVYYLLNNRNTDCCKVVKMRLSSRKIIKVSGVLSVHHGNDITYDTRYDRLVIANSTGATKTVSIVNPKTLKHKRNVTVELPDKLPGMTASNKKYYNGFGAIAYNKTHKKFVVLLRGSNNHHLLILNNKLKPVRFLNLAVKAKQTVQGIDSCGNSILVGQSYSDGKPYNNIYVYDWDGNFKSIIWLGKSKEFETVFHSGSNFYVGFYTSFYKKRLFSNVYDLQRNGYFYRIKDM